MIYRSKTSDAFMEKQASPQTHYPFLYRACLFSSEITDRTVGQDSEYHPHFHEDLAVPGADQHDTPVISEAPPHFLAFSIGA
jgi:hypothetical protein